MASLLAMGGGQKIAYSDVVIASAYNSLPGQTDSSPWTTASGTRCHEGVIASNHLPMGTRVMIEGFGDKVFVVEDRMNKRYYKRVDIWFRDYNQARKFGVRKLRYYVLASA
ncbi:MAG: 3D domain-containing protein [Candidatus Margulisbacteria bacterium]|nr:3D domain-containing protein [Candidatus Margulisiibacteriota bacterium]